MTSARRRRGHTAIPKWLWIPAGVGIAFLVIPIIGMITRIDPGRVGELVSAPESQLAMGLSLTTSLIAALTCLVIGFPLGYLLATRTFPGQRLVRTLILLPLVLPPVVSGLALLYTWGRSAFLGSLLTEVGLGLAYTTAAVVFAQIFVSLPFMVMSVETAVAARGREYELASAELGATPNRVFFQISLPLLRHGIMTGVVLCFARALGEFGATLTFAGSLSGVTRTMPLQIYLVRESDPQSAIALSLLLILVALVIIVFAYRSPHAPRLRTLRTPVTTAEDNANTDAPSSFTSAATGPVATGAGTTHVAGSTEAANRAGDSSTIDLRARLAERGLDVELTLPTATTTAIIGRNGAGKSSLFQLMTGAIGADSGWLRIGDESIFDLDADDWPPVHARGIVHLAQKPLLFPHLSVIDNVAFGLRAHGHPPKQALSSAQAMLDSLGVGHCANRRPEAVSGGQAARIALARALVTDPKLLLLDEPLAALDVDVRIATRGVLAQALTGHSAVIITHDVADVTALASTLVLIDNGSATYVASVDESGSCPGDDETFAGVPGEEFLRSFCAPGREGILCRKSQ